MTNNNLFALALSAFTFGCAPTIVDTGSDSFYVETDVYEGGCNVIPIEATIYEAKINGEPAEATEYEEFYRFDDCEEGDVLYVVYSY